MSNNLSDKIYHTFAGKIARASAYGVQLMQHQESDRWLNYGKFFEGNKLESGDVGLEYTINVTETPAGGYYIKNISQGLQAEDSVKPNEIPPKNIINANGQVVPKKTNIDEDRKQQLIVRQNSISNACLLLQNKKDVKAEEVLKYAQEFENWVFRTQDSVPSIDLDLDNDVPF
jgi:hypothetical protein